MLGAIAGDIIGSRFEGHPAPPRDFELFHPACRFTDDTVCTVAIADGLLGVREVRRTVPQRPGKPSFANTAHRGLCERSFGRPRITVCLATSAFTARAEWTAS
jgi:hypothetical protein